MFAVQVSSWLRPNVNQRGKAPGSGTIHIAKKTVINILATAGTPYSLEDLRKMFTKLGPEANSDFRSRFSLKDQEIALKFPRAKVQKETLAIIDSCKYNNFKSLLFPMYTRVCTEYLIIVKK